MCTGQASHIFCFSIPCCPHAVCTRRDDSTRNETIVCARVVTVQYFMVEGTMKSCVPFLSATRRDVTECRCDRHGAMSPDTDLSIVSQDKRVVAAGYNPQQEQPLKNSTICEQRHLSNMAIAV